MTIYLCTCGTSAARTLQVPPGRRFDADYVAELGGIEAASDAVFASCQGYSIDDDSALRNKLSAEIHSLARMQVGGSDKVILYGSETPDGLACAHAVRRFLERARPNLPCFVHRIEGLQVTDAYRFRTQGVVNFTKSIVTEIDAYGAPQCVLNPTGGFKSLVPYTVLIGMIKGVPAKYIFEQSTALISLPVMPVDFARERLEPIRPLLERIERDSAIPRADLDTAIPFDDRAYLEPLFEDLGKGQTTLSPVGFLVREELDRPSGLVPYLSRRALDDLIKLRGINNIDPERYLRRVAASREQFYRVLAEARQHRRPLPGQQRGLAPPRLAYHRPWRI